MNNSNLLVHARTTISIDKALRTQLLWMLLLRTVLYTLLLAISYVFQGPEFDAIVLPANLLILLLLTIYLTTIISAFFLLVFQGSVRKFGFLQILIDTFFVSLLVFFTGASNSIFTSVFFFPIIAGGLILPRKGGVIAAAAATLQYAVLLFLELNQLYPTYLLKYIAITPSNPMVVLNHFSVHGLTFFLAAVLSAMFGIRLRRAETALSDSLRDFDRLAILYKQIFDNISTGIVTIDGESVITSANNAINEITGYRPDSLIGQELTTVFPDIELSEENIRLTFDFTKDNDTTVRIGYAHMNIQNTDNEQPVSDTPQKIITLRDISEFEKLERQVRQTEKLAAIGMMSASIAHDFRNPLTAISGSAQMLANDFSSEGTKNYANFELANIILRESNRVIVTIADFLKFSRPEHATCNWFSLHLCIDEVLQVLKADPEWPTTARVVLDFKKTVDVWADERQMFTVLNHIIQNGLAFCPEGNECITITAYETRDPEDLEIIKISIRDNGPGVDDNKREHIFEPFYTTRSDGTGLGLAIVKQTIEEHYGTIAVSNTENGGAVFTIALPCPH